MIPAVSASSIKQYLDYVHSIPYLSATEEVTLLENIQDGCRDSAQKLILHNLSNVANIAKKYACSKVPFEDLIQEGNIALMKSVKNFDLAVSKGVRFISYAGHYIKSAILSYIYKNFKLIDIVKTKEQKKIFNNASMFRSSKLDMDEAMHISNKLEVSIESVIDMHARLNIHSQSVIIGEDGVYDVLPIEDDRYNPSRLLEQWDEENHIQEKLKESIALLDDREKTILHLRWLSDDKKTQKEVGEILNISHERVRQLEQRILLKLHNLLK